jgi:hypothetical protein
MTTASDEYDTRYRKVLILVTIGEPEAKWAAHPAEAEALPDYFNLF